MKNIHCLHGTQGIQTVAFDSIFECRLLSLAALSRVAPPNHTGCVAARGGDGGTSEKGWGRGGASGA